MLSIEVSREIENIAKRLGIGKYEINAYLTLLLHPGITATEISSEGRIPISKVYTILNKLLDYEFIYATQERPKKYYPYPPRTVAQKIVQREVEQIEAIVEKLSELLEAAKVKIREMPSIAVIYDKNELNNIIRLLIQTSEEKILISYHKVMEKAINESIGDLEIAVARGINLKLIVPKNAETPFPEKLLNGRVSYRRRLFGGGIVVDSKKVLIVLPRTQLVRQTLGILSSHIVLAQIAEEYYEYLWKESE